MDATRVSMTSTTASTTGAHQPSSRATVRSAAASNTTRPAS